MNPLSIAALCVALFLASWLLPLGSLLDDAIKGRDDRNGVAAVLTASATVGVITVAIAFLAGLVA